MAKSSKDAKYFNPSRKGEIHELQQELDTGKIEQKRDCLKKIIAAMTIGKDVSMLFPDVVKQIRTTDLELKKLVYLYIMNYAKTQPDLAILSVNAFVHDSTRNPNPLVRALAIRTMGCIRVEKITEYLCQPLQQCLKDADPYVRKTAAVCVAKLFDISPDLVESQGFLDMLNDLLADSNPMVVSNAVAALAEISETSSYQFSITSSNLNKLLAALNECTEWGQIFILSSLASYDPQDGREAEAISERVTARLQHNNSAVVLSAIRVLMKYLDFIKSPEVTRVITKKMAAPLITLLSKEPELQYVALRNLILILQKRPAVLSSEMKVFFCKYNDPLYVKMEKLEIIIMLTCERNVEQVLMELKEYATAADVEFVRKSVHAIGNIAIKLERAAERCIHVLLELIENGYNPVVQESIVIIKDIFRKYPNQYESIIAKLCENLEVENLEPEARASMIWILGHYAERIDNADSLLFGFMESFLDDTAEVQLQLLTAIVKLFLKRPRNTKDMVLQVLQMATECANPDIRDRGFMYWKLLTSPSDAKEVVLCDKPLIHEASDRIAPEVLDVLVSDLGTLAAVFHQPPETFVPKLRRGQAQAAAERLRQLKESNLAGTTARPAVVEQSQAEQAVHQQVIAQTAANLLDLDLGPPPSMGIDLTANAQPQGDLLGGGLLGGDLLGGPIATQSAPAPAAPAATQQPELMSSAAGEGLRILGSMVRDASSPAGVSLSMTLINESPIPLANFAMQFNKNTFGIAPAGALSVQQLGPGQSANTVLQLVVAPQHRPPAATPPSTKLQIAIKDNREKIHFFETEYSIGKLFSQDGQLPAKEYLENWAQLKDSEVQNYVNIQVPSVDVMQERLTSNNVFLVARRTVNGKEVLYMSLKVIAQIPFLLEIVFDPASPQKCFVSVRSRATPIIPLVQSALQSILSA